MSRYRRLYCPGLAVHMVSRVVTHAKRFDAPTRAEVVSILAEASTRTDAQILAYAVATNHLHIVARQQQDPISSLMQPALRRVALLVQRRCRVEGHAFEHQFRSNPCATGTHLRDAIVTAHLSAMRAKGRAHPRHGDATSHDMYANPLAQGSPGNFVNPALELFSTSRHTCLAQWREDYLDYVAYRMQCDLDVARGMMHSRMHPDVGGGDDFFCASLSILRTGARERQPPLDLRDIAVDALSEHSINGGLAALCAGRIGSGKLRSIRAVIIRRAAIAGHQGVAIAAFFNMSASRVSELVRQPLPGHENA